MDLLCTYPPWNEASKFATWKWMVGIRGRLGRFSGAMLVSGSVVFVRFLCVDVGSQMPLVGAFWRKQALIPGTRRAHHIDLFISIRVDARPLYYGWTKILKQVIGSESPASLLALYCFQYVGVSKNIGTPKSSILEGVSLINHPFWGTIIFGNTHII